MQGITRVLEYEQTLVMADAADGSGAQLMLHYFDDPRCNIPAWLLNWAASTGVPRFIAKLKCAVQAYERRAAAAATPAP